MTGSGVHGGGGCAGAGDHALVVVTAVVSSGSTGAMVDDVEVELVGSTPFIREAALTLGVVAFESTEVSRRAVRLWCWRFASLLDCYASFAQRICATFNYGGAACCATVV